MTAGSGSGHLPVLVEEVVSFLDPGPGEIHVDMTVGLGGHAEAVLEAGGGTSRLVGIDRDPDALVAAARRLARFGDRVRLVRGRFSCLVDLLDGCGVGSVDGVVADLGVSSPQLDRPERGFSFLHDGPLDMRMDPGQERTAADIVAEFSEEALADLFWTFGEERYARRIARAIVRARAGGRLRRTGALAEVVARAVPGGRRAGRRIHPATRVFQALRMAVNDELGELERGLAAAWGRLRPGGRLVVITFHSLEDRVVKRFMAARTGRCTCPPRQIVCTCSPKASLALLARKPIRPSDRELEVNPRARSAKLRAARKLE